MVGTCQDLVCSTTESQASVARSSNFSQEAGSLELCVWNLPILSPCTLPAGAKSSRGPPSGDHWLVHIGMRHIYLCLEILYPARAQIGP